MRRDELDHLVRAALGILDADSVIVAGSQAILGSRSDAERLDAVARSTEADLLPSDDSEEVATLIDGTIGELSAFHDAFGVYAQGITSGLLRLPSGWQTRLVPLDITGPQPRRAYCLSIPDVWIAKALAQRPKDWDFCVAVLAHGLVGEAEVRQLVATMDLSAQESAAIDGMIARARNLRGRGLAD